MVPNAKSNRLEDAGQRRASPEFAAPLGASDVQDLGSVESPARRLQLELERSWAHAGPAKRWSPRRSLAFILLTNGALWAAVIWGVARIV